MNKVIFSLIVLMLFSVLFAGFVSATCDKMGGACGTGIWVEDSAGNCECSEKAVQLYGGSWSGGTYYPGFYDTCETAKKGDVWGVRYAYGAPVSYTGYPFKAGGKCVFASSLNTLAPFNSNEIMNKHPWNVMHDYTLTDAKVYSSYFPWPCLGDYKGMYIDYYGIQTSFSVEGCIPATEGRECGVWIDGKNPRGPEVDGVGFCDNGKCMNENSYSSHTSKGNKCYEIGTANYRGITTFDNYFGYYNQEYFSLECTKDGQKPARTQKYSSGSIWYSFYDSCYKMFNYTHDWAKDISFSRCDYCGLKNSEFDGYGLCAFKDSNFTKTDIGTGCFDVVSQSSSSLLGKDGKGYYPYVKGCPEENNGKKCYRIVDEQVIDGTCQDGKCINLGGYGLGGKIGICNNKNPISSCGNIANQTECKNAYEYHAFCLEEIEYPACNYDCKWESGRCKNTGLECIAPVVDECISIGEEEEENPLPKIEGKPTIIYINEKSNLLSLVSENEKGKIKINSVVYDKPIISDDWTKIEDLTLKIGSKKIVPIEPAEPVNKVSFDTADIGLVYNELPKDARFYLKVTDDGTMSGTDVKGEIKSAVLDTTARWCPTELKLKGGYDVRVSAKQKIMGGPLNLVTVYAEDELMFNRIFKELSAEIVFHKNNNIPITGKFTVHSINDIRHGLSEYGSRPKIEIGRSYAIKKLQRKIVKELGININEEIAKWGCAKGHWKNQKVEEKKDNKPEVWTEVCDLYKSETLEYTFVYDLEKDEIEVTGKLGNPGKVEKILLIKMPKSSKPYENFKKFLNIIAEDEPNAVNVNINPDTQLKIAVDGYKPDTGEPMTGGKGSGYLNEDWHNTGDEHKPSAVVNKVMETVTKCLWSDKNIPFLVDTGKNTITNEGQYASYYYIQDSFLRTEEDLAVKLSLNSQINKPIKKIFTYNESIFDDENFISLYRYEDTEIEDECYVNITSEKIFNVTESGGNFTFGTVRIEIPENAITSSANLTISFVNVTDCIKKVDKNKNKKVDLEELLIYIKQDYAQEISNYFEFIRYVLKWETR